MGNKKLYRLLARHGNVDTWAAVPDAPLMTEDGLVLLYDGLMQYCIPVGGEYKGNVIWVTQIAPGKQGFITVEEVAD